MSFDIEAEVQRLKESGLWIECHEKGHDLVDIDYQVCVRCGMDFEQVIQDIIDDYPDSIDSMLK